MREIADVQYITRDDASLSHSEQVRLMYENGVSWVQIRMKNVSDSVLLSEAEKSMAFATEFNGTLIINDNIEIAKKVAAHGVHIGLNDCSVEQAREYLGDETIIGATANTFEHVQKHVADNVNYIGLGPYKFTNTKKNLSPVIGVEGYTEIVAQMQHAGIEMPVVAVGGITMEDITLLKNIGLHGVAMSKALMESVLK